MFLTKTSVQMHIIGRSSSPNTPTGMASTTSNDVRGGLAVHLRQSLACNWMPTKRWV